MHMYTHIHTHAHTHYCLYVTIIYTLYIKTNPVSLSYHIQLYIYICICAKYSNFCAFGWENVTFQQRSEVSNSFRIRILQKVPDPDPQHWAQHCNYLWYRYTHTHQFFTSRCSNLSSINTFFLRICLKTFHWSLASSTVQYSGILSSFALLIRNNSLRIRKSGIMYL